MSDDVVEVERGDSLNLSGTVTDSADAPLAFDTATLEVRRVASDPDPIYRLQVNQSATVGSFALSVPPAALDFPARGYPAKIIIVGAAPPLRKTHKFTLSITEA